MCPSPIRNVRMKSPFIADPSSDAAARKSIEFSRRVIVRGAMDPRDKPEDDTSRTTRAKVRVIRTEQRDMSNDKDHNTDRGFLRGLQSYGDRDFSIYMRRAFAKSMGYTGEELGRPIVGIAYTHSRFNPCHRHFPELLDAIKRGVAAAGGLALEFPTTSLHESTLAPNSMKFRNLMAMDTEEMIRAQPMDSVVLMGGCDKTVPAQLMGAASAGKPP